jgi:phospholipase C
MVRSKQAVRLLDGCRVGLSALVLAQLPLTHALADPSPPSGQPVYSADGRTQTPIKHVIVIIGENRSFDHVFATYVPQSPGQTVNNLLSEGIVVPAAKSLNIRSTRGTGGLSRR